jgi:hypothetical protein
MITDAAFDRLIAIYEQDRILWAAAHAQHSKDGAAGLRKLVLAHGIDPDA